MSPFFLNKGGSDNLPKITQLEKRQSWDPNSKGGAPLRNSVCYLPSHILGGTPRHTHSCFSERPCAGHRKLLPFSRGPALWASRLGWGYHSSQRLAAAHQKPGQDETSPFNIGWPGMA